MAEKNVDVLKLVLSIGLCEFAGIVGSLFTIQSIPTWYAGINKPGFNPPAWVFAPVWTFLFLLMGISLYLVWSKEQVVEKPLKVFGVQLTLNVLWSFLFFGLESPLYAFMEILLLWAAIVVTILEFSKVSKASSLLLVPYLLWVSFAAMLNLSIYLLNA